MARLRKLAPEQLAAYSNANPDFKAIFEDQQEFRGRYDEYPFLFKFPD
jgi:TRAP-type mannitol/chloroaromatic compound transport system substrate-binding protein